MAKGDNVIHVRLEYGEALQSKKDILLSEADLINMIQSKSKYALLRGEELKLKAKFYREIKKVAMEIKMLETNLPHVKIPGMIKHPEEKKSEIAVPGISGNLENQLMDIQRRLRALSY